MRFVVGVKLENYEISIVREMVSTAEGKILGVCLPNSTVGELRSGVREEGIPPIEETGGVAVRGDWVVTRAMTRRDWTVVSTTTRTITPPNALTRTANNTDGDRLAEESLVDDLLYSSAATYVEPAL